ncbi:hypothetical protein [Pectinatus cerevisiiphilus]|uniref:Uncharacterized protein n=1 Tax=Pectinatus cerevisiiphilus TaxID=86956 RepID=A0A4R3KDU8_9FIRM|nr:hypothetical protein [Pectinatus cerevisiiphilus]TCS81476.1 hypothetical protein EDC37_102182 [Pectinatus cerevisiiphilus]
MMPVIAAVGSNHLIANEICLLTENILNGKIPISCFRTDEIQNIAPADFYICAPTQYDKLRHVLPSQRLFIFELIPTSTFFLEIARIPKKSTVYVFNNLLPYTKTLISYCIALGIDNLCFKAIAYENMSLSEITSCLKKAKYIIGVDRFVGPEVLLSPFYKKYLQKDVKIIAAKRTASVRSSCIFLHALATFYYTHAQKEYHCLLQFSPPTDASVLALKKLAIKIDETINNIRTASVQIIANQIDLSAKETCAEISFYDLNDNKQNDFSCLSHIVNRLLLTFAILNKKLEYISK